jgi:hypothetical protein
MRKLIILTSFLSLLLLSPIVHVNATFLKKHSILKTPVKNLPPKILGAFNALLSTIDYSTARPTFFPYPVTPTWTREQEEYTVVYYYSSNGCDIRKITATFKPNGMLVDYNIVEVIPCILIDI